MSWAVNLAPRLFLPGVPFSDRVRTSPRLSLGAATFAAFAGGHLPRPAHRRAWLERPCPRVVVVNINPHHGAVLDYVRGCPNATPEDMAVDQVVAELRAARVKHPGTFNSAHEGYAVIAEELDELWDEVKRDNLQRAREEAVQVAAMALRFLIDLRIST